MSVRPLQFVDFLECIEKFSKYIRCKTVVIDNVSPVLMDTYAAIPDLAI